MEITIYEPKKIDIEPLPRRDYGVINQKVATAIKRASDYFVTGDEPPLDYEYFNYVYELHTKLGYDEEPSTHLISLATFDNGEVFQEELNKSNQMEIEPTLVWSGTCEGIEIDQFLKLIESDPKYNIYDIFQFSTREMMFGERI